MSWKNFSFVVAICLVSLLAISGCSPLHLLRPSQWDKLNGGPEYMPASDYWSLSKPITEDSVGFASIPDPVSEVVQRDASLGRP